MVMRVHECIVCVRRCSFFLQRVAMALVLGASTLRLTSVMHASCPFQEGKKGGFLGGMKGFGKGLAGVVTKPITGITDFASSTMQGIEAQVGRDWGLIFC